MLPHCRTRLESRAVSVFEAKEVPPLEESAEELSIYRVVDFSKVGERAPGGRTVAASSRFGATDRRNPTAGCDARANAKKRYGFQPWSQQFCGFNHGFIVEPNGMMRFPWQYQSALWFQPWFRNPGR